MGTSGASLEHATTIMGKTTDLTVVQKTIIDTLYKEGKPQMDIAERGGGSQSTVSKYIHRKLAGRKGAQATEMTTALGRLSGKADSRT